MRPYAALLILFCAHVTYGQDVAANAPAPSVPSSATKAGAAIVAPSQSKKQNRRDRADLWTLVPRPYIFMGPELMGGGYSPVAALEGVGLRIDSKHLLFDANATYDNGHKTSDGTEPNPKGHDRGLQGSLYYRLSSGWAFGGGAKWSQLSTSNYSKTAWRPTFGGSKDLFTKGCVDSWCGGSLTMRLGVDFVSKGTDWRNGSQGAELSIYIPSPSLKGHLFWREKIGVYRYYTTVTDPGNRYLTREQMSNTDGNCFVEFTVMYRFF